MSSKSEGLVINEVLAVARAVKKHLKEVDCKHDIRFIINEALDENAGLPAQQENPTPEKGVATIFRTSENGNYKYK